MTPSSFNEGERIEAIEGYLEKIKKQIRDLKIEINARSIYPQQFDNIEVLIAAIEVRLGESK